MINNPQRDLALSSARHLMEAFADCPLPDWDLLAPSANLVSFDRGATILPAFTAHPHFYIVQRGVVKLRMVTRASTPTIRFFAEGEVAGVYNALGTSATRRMVERGLFGPDPDPRIFPEGSPFDVVAVEPSTLLDFDFTIIEMLASRHAGWARMIMAYQTALLLSLHASLPEVHVGSAEERFREFTLRRPDLVRRLSQREIAAHMGVTEVGMSRIVKRVNVEGSRTQRESGPADRLPLTADTLSPRIV